MDICVSRWLLDDFLQKNILHTYIFYDILSKLSGLMAVLASS